MRSVYDGLAVHSFDVLTDVLVIMEWLRLSTTPNISYENVDLLIITWSKIAVIIIITQNIRRALLQLFDMLIFEEIYESYKEIVSQFKNKKWVSIFI